jgi:enoyl-CoA hydratase/carnithine racemase
VADIVAAADVAQGTFYTYFDSKGSGLRRGLQARRRDGVRREACSRVDRPMNEVLVDSADGVATVTLNRPGSRNAINLALLNRLSDAVSTLDADGTVRAIVLTGADPAFCAGLDLAELAVEDSPLHDILTGGAIPGPWPPIGTPVIAAVNGPAVTGGLELVLNCDIVLASDRAAFADTHARVGVMPGWGLTVLLPQAVGRSLARQMSLTGDFITAAQACAAGLASEVVPHAELLSRARTVAATIAGNDPRAVRSLLASYKRVEAESVGAGHAVEESTAAEWNAGGLDLAEAGRRRAAIIDRGREQAGG